MKQVIFLIQLVVFTLSTQAFAKSGVSSCAEDEITRNDINEYPEQRRLYLTNWDGETVGAFILAEEGEVSEVESLYLCGHNSGYYYAEGTLNSRVGKKIGDKMPIEFNNDEYVAEGYAKTVAMNTKSARLAITLKVAFLGEEKWADYERFTTTFFVNVPLK